MNDTTRDELRKQVGGELVIAYTIGSDRKETDFTDTADRIIALVTAARDAEIREALLSDEVVEAAQLGHVNTDVRDYGYYTIPDGNWSHEDYERDAMRNALQAALAAAKGTEGSE